MMASCPEPPLDSTTCGGSRDSTSSRSDGSPMQQTSSHFPAARGNRMADQATGSQNSSGGSGSGRRKREFTPSEKKDASYWDKRRKNNEAAKRSREKRRLNDLVLETRVLGLLDENARLKAELLALKFRFGLDVEPQANGADLHANGNGTGGSNNNNGSNHHHQHHNHHLGQHQHNQQQHQHHQQLGHHHQHHHSGSGGSSSSNSSSSGSHHHYQHHHQQHHQQPPLSAHHALFVESLGGGRAYGNRHDSSGCASPASGSGSVSPVFFPESASGAAAATAPPAAAAGAGDRCSGPADATAVLLDSKSVAAAAARDADLTAAAAAANSASSSTSSLSSTSSTSSLSSSPCVPGSRRHGDGVESAEEPPPKRANTVPAGGASERHALRLVATMVTPALADETPLKSPSPSPSSCLPHKLRFKQSAGIEDAAAAAMAAIPTSFFPSSLGPGVVALTAPPPPPPPRPGSSPGPGYSGVLRRAPPDRHPSVGVVSPTWRRMDGLPLPSSAAVTAATIVATVANPATAEQRSPPKTTQEGDGTLRVACDTGDIADISSSSSSSGVSASGGGNATVAVAAAPAAGGGAAHGVNGADGREGTGGGEGGSGPSEGADPGPGGSSGTPEGAEGGGGPPSDDSGAAVRAENEHLRTELSSLSAEVAKLKRLFAEGFLGKGSATAAGAAVTGV
ncbi:mucin-19-like [Lethenteron reissneri]|uniref:mucin-19-like n=1 Tax=Lethenteron reissneri TaxID=7753 RepID=UPI002AB61116|nr:mucin-19-like [Lethenteron reissneri]